MAQCLIKVWFGFNAVQLNGAALGVFALNLMMLSILLSKLRPTQTYVGLCMVHSLIDLSEVTLNKDFKIFIQKLDPCTTMNRN